ncbi:AraC family transcriptional regulator [Microbacterium saperdae]|jgi:AraC-like DNA-binding protein|uniref:AraC-like DNA-binding protein n=2 Tax=Microbacterium saperdae TaxID=69368 RepID=A0A543BBC8_9MICO|nr:AraC-like DNA-binding protein [Microbacterium saperdae]GGM37579.1 AraC family transcriptional regulator [Microbacterium saperdae]
MVDMDISLLAVDTRIVLIPDGFPGQRMLVLPRPLVNEVFRMPGTPQLIVTDCGYFPRAQSHGKRRTTAIDEVVVIVCVDGAGWCETATGHFPVTRGQVLVLPPGHEHAYGADEDDPWTLWWFHAAGPELERFLERAGMTIENPVRRPHDPHRVATLLTEILQWAERDTTLPSLLAASGAAWHALTHLAASRTAADDTDELIEQSVQYLREHLAEPLSVSDLAASVALSTSHFSSLFKRHTGQPVLRYLTMLRMARARELLHITNWTIASIAAEVGFPDAFYFARQFKKVHGVSPRAYRG